VQSFFPTTTSLKSGVAVAKKNMQVGNASGGRDSERLIWVPRPGYKQCGAVVLSSLGRGGPSRRRSGFGARRRAAPDVGRRSASSKAPQQRSTPNLALGCAFPFGFSGQPEWLMKMRSEGWPIRPMGHQRGIARGLRRAPWSCIEIRWASGWSRDVFSVASCGRQTVGAGTCPSLVEEVAIRICNERGACGRRGGSLARGFFPSGRARSLLFQCRKTPSIERRCWTRSCNGWLSQSRSLKSERMGTGRQVPARRAAGDYMLRL